MSFVSFWNGMFVKVIFFVSYLVKVSDRDADHPLAARVQCDGVLARKGDPPSWDSPDDMWTLDRHA
jgi:hypothetical protein